MRFNSANAKENNAKSLQARKANEEARRQRLARAETFAAEGSTEEYLRSRVLRVRTQIEEVSTRIDEALAKRDPQALKYLTESLSRLQELERTCDGRQAPGVWRTTAPRTARPSLVTVEPEPLAVDG